MTETFKDIEGYGGLYQVSKGGKVKSFPRNGTLGGTLKPDILRGGYYQVRLYKNNKSKSWKVHRLVAKAFIPNPNNNPLVCHKDGKPSNNFYKNLYWGTSKNNSFDSLKHGTRPLGENHWKAKLTEKNVREIRKLSAAKKKSYSQLGKIYGVSKSHIGLIVQKKSWK